MSQFKADKRAWLAFKTLLLLPVILAFQPSHAQSFPNIKQMQAVGEKRSLQLDVLINNQPTKLIGKFLQDDEGKIYIDGKELNDIGFKLPSNAKVNDIIALDNLDGVTHRYDMPTQSIHFDATDAARLVKEYIPNMMGDEKEKEIRVRNYGGVVNYSLYSSVSRDFQGSSTSFSGVSGTFETRVFGAFGALSTTTMVGNATTIKRAEAIRLDSTWTYSSPESLMVAKAGDLISGGHIWNRPVRLGGAQISKNFGLRPDLITQAMPGVAGSAAVPSIVDVYVNNTKTYSQEVGSGPFRITNLPVMGNNGTAKVVVREPNGRVSETTQSFLINSHILAKGLFDYSLSAGYTRHEYGIKSNSYNNKLASVASGRYGLYDNLTLETNAEVTAKFANLGAGFVTSVMSKHLLTLAGSFSKFEDKSGAMVFGSYETTFDKLFLSASSQRTFGNYYDLAAVTAKPVIIQTIDPYNPFAVPTSSINTTFNAINQSLLPPKAVDRITIGAPLPWKNMSISTSYVHLLSNENQRSHIINGTLNMSVGKSSTAYLTAFADRGDKKSYGVFAGFIMPLGKNNDSTLSFGATSDTNGSYMTADYSKSMAPEGDSWGYRLRDMEGKSSVRAAALMMRNKYSYGELTATQQGNSAHVTTYLEGAVAAAGGGVFMSNRINESFAVVKTTAPDVEVFYENRLMGKSDKSGKILIPYLRSNQTNRVTLNPNNLPLTASIDTTKTVAVPADKGVSIVDFGVIADPKAAIVIFKRADGKEIPPGSEGSIEGGENFVVGFEGKAYVKGLSDSNNATIVMGSTQCGANFNYVKNEAGMTKISPVVCK